MTRCPPFRALRTFRLLISRSGFTKIDKHEYIDAASSFILSLPPLESLRLEIQDNMSPGSFRFIIRQHGGSLRRLHILTSGNLDSTKFDAVLVDEIRRQCPLLEDLKLPIRRSKGDRQEQAIYKSLGATSRLQDLDLVLDCANESVWRCKDQNEDTEVFNDPSIDDFHQAFYPHNESPKHGFPTPRNGHVRDALVNSALDETLAHSIFRCISASKGCDDLPLHCLELCTRGGSLFPAVNKDYNSPHRYYSEMHDPYGLNDAVRQLGHHMKLVQDIGCPGHLTGGAIYLGTPPAVKQGGKYQRTCIDQRD